MSYLPPRSQGFVQGKGNLVGGSKGGQPPGHSQSHLSSLRSTSWQRRGGQSYQNHSTLRTNISRNPVTHFHPWTPHEGDIGWAKLCVPAAIAEAAARRNVPLETQLPSFSRASARNRAPALAVSQSSANFIPSTSGLSRNDNPNEPTQTALRPCLVLFVTQDAAIVAPITAYANKTIDEYPRTEMPPFKRHISYPVPITRCHGVVFRGKLCVRQHAPIPGWVGRKNKQDDPNIPQYLLLGAPVKIDLDAQKLSPRLEKLHAECPRIAKPWLERFQVEALTSMDPEERSWFFKLEFAYTKSVKFGKPGLLEVEAEHSGPTLRDFVDGELEPTRRAGARMAAELVFGLTQEICDTLLAVVKGSNNNRGAVRSKVDDLKTILDVVEVLDDRIAGSEPRVGVIGPTEEEVGRGAKAQEIARLEDICERHQGK